ncbi:MAG: transglutaminase-like domain-containing protein [Spirochaetales bacterium]
MTKRFLSGAALTLGGLVLMVSSCANPVAPVSNSIPLGASGVLAAEGFESGDLTHFRWNATSVDSVLPTVQTTTVAEGTHAVQFPMKDLGVGQALHLWFQVEPTAAAAVSFRVTSDAYTKASLTFFVDGEQKAVWADSSDWVRSTVVLTAGAHRLEWVARKDDSGYYNSSSNSFFLDDITLASETTESVSLSPATPLVTTVGSGSLDFAAQALRADGSTRMGGTFTWVVNPGTDGGSGTIDASGHFLPGTAGTCTVTASSEGHPTTSATITVKAALGTVRYAGQDYLGPEPGSGTVPQAASQGILITLPNTTDFRADGFFTLQGRVAAPSVYNYALVVETLASEYGTTSPVHTTSWYVQGDFSTRIWLRFGAGDYVVTVHTLSSLQLDLAGEGDIMGYSWYPTPVVRLNVTNTRSEDGTFFYPSDAVQSDSDTVTNLALSLAGGSLPATESAKTAAVTAVNKWIVDNYHYDQTSVVSGQRQKQDALTSLRLATGVCEGYASTAAALLRALGIRTKAVRGDGYSTPTEFGAHAWNNVFIGGTWLFLDTTWNDPVYTGTPTPAQMLANSQKYLLLTTMGGVEQHTNGRYWDHVLSDERLGRALLAEVAPRWSGYPDGWY